jgi:DNA recombination-dependent growth factor C
MSKPQFPPFNAATIFKLVDVDGKSTAAYRKIEQLAIEMRSQGWSDKPVEKLLFRDPSPTQWQSIGFIDSLSGVDYPLDQANSVTWCVQIADRVLPSKVRDEHLQKRVADIEGREHRKVSKKEYRELRDEVEVDLLPRAFIRRSYCLVTFMPNSTFIIWSSSARRCDQMIDQVMSLLDVVTGASPSIASYVDPEVRVGSEILLPLVRNDEHDYVPSYSGVLFKDDAEESARVVRMKNVSMISDNALRLLDDGYEIRELHITDQDETVEFTLTDSFTFKRINVIESSDDAGDKDDRARAWEASLWLRRKHIMTAAMALSAIAEGDDAL